MAMASNTNYRAIIKQLQREIDYKRLGQKMQKIRLERGLTQLEVADRMKMGEKYYAAIEAGSAKINLIRLIQFVCIMQISADELLIGSHPDYPSKYDREETEDEERKMLNKLLDQCSNQDLKTIYIIAKELRKR